MTFSLKFELYVVVHAVYPNPQFTTSRIIMLIYWIQNIFRIKHDNDTFQLGIRVQWLMMLDIFIHELYFLFCFWHFDDTRNTQLFTNDACMKQPKEKSLKAMRLLVTITITNYSFENSGTVKLNSNIIFHRESRNERKLFIQSFLQ